MRVIKFRAWDNSTKKMYYNSGLTVHNNNVIHMDGEIMQFTGLLDKNGKEIYEGDIIKLHDHPTSIEDCTTSVVFNHGSFVAKYNGILLSDYGTAWTEVIGNIYETPELLSQ